MDDPRLSHEQVLGRLGEFVDCSTWGEAWAVLQRHPTLREDIAIDAASFYILLLERGLAASKSGDTLLAEKLDRRRSLLWSCAIEDGTTWNLEAYDAAHRLGPPSWKSLRDTAVSAQEHYAATGDVRALDLANAVWKHTVEHHPGLALADVTSRAWIYNEAAVVALTCFQERGSREELERAVSLWDQVLAELPPRARDRWKYLSNLANAWYLDFDSAGDSRALERSIATHETAVGETPEEDAQRPGALSGLAVALRARYEHAGQPGDLDRAIAALEEAVQRSLGSAQHSLYQSNLGHLLVDRHLRSASIDDLNRALELQQREGDNLQDTRSSARATATRGRALLVKYGVTRQLGDLEEAVSVLDAVQVEHLESPARAIHLSAVGSALLDRYLRTGAIEDVKRALAAQEQAVASTAPRAPDRWNHLNNLANTHKQLYLRLGERRHLERAIELHRQVLVGAPATSPGRPLFLSNLGGALRTRAVDFGVDTDLDPAIAAFAEALSATTPGSPDEPRHRYNYANGVRMRYESRGDPEDLQVAVEAFRRSSRDGVRVAAEVGLTAARNWGAWASGRGDWLEAAEAYDYGLESMHTLVRTQLVRRHKEAWLRDARGLPGAASNAVAHTGDPRRAAVALERGRALLLSEALDHSEYAIARIGGTDRRDLAERFRAAVNRLAELEQSGFAAESAVAGV